MALPYVAPAPAPTATQTDIPPNSSALHAVTDSNFYARFHFANPLPKPYEVTAPAQLSDLFHKPDKVIRKIATPFKLHAWEIISTHSQSPPIHQDHFLIPQIPPP